MFPVAHQEVLVMAEKALVVDNDFFFVGIPYRTSRKKGYEVIKAYDGKEGISKLGEGTFDILFAVFNIMPKIDGLQLIKFARRKFSEMAGWPFIAISDTLIEQMDDVDMIGADYCVVKGPLEGMTKTLNDLLNNLQDHGLTQSGSGQLVEPGKLYPRQATAELIEELKFQKTIFDSVGIGILVLDRDARVMSANAMALELLNKPIEDVVESQGYRCFSSGRTGSAGGGFKRGG